MNSPRRHERSIGGKAAGGENPLDVAPEALFDVEVSVTVIGGEIVYCGEGAAFAAPLCPAP